MSPVRLGKRFATGHRGDLSAAMVCREMCCEMKNLARDASLYLHRECMYKLTTFGSCQGSARGPGLVSSCDRTDYLMTVGVDTAVSDLFSEI